MPTKTTARPAKKAPAKKAPAARKTPAKAPAKRPAKAAAPATAPDPRSGHQLTLSQEVPVSRILPNVDNIRSDIGDVTELADSIRAHGVIEPLIGYAPDPPVDGYDVVLIAGHRRHAAATKARLATVPMVIRAQPDRAELFELMLAENNHRSDLDPIDEALALKAIRDAGRKSLKEIAAAVNRSEPWVKGRLALIEILPEAVWPQIRTGELSVTDATMVATAKGLTDTQRKRIANLDADEIKREVANAVSAARKKARLQTVAKKHPGAVVTYENPAYGRLPKKVDAPFGVARYGDKPGQINRLPEMDDPAQHLVFVDEYSPKAKPVVWHTAPHLLDPADFGAVATPERDDLTPLADIALLDPTPVKINALPGEANWYGWRNEVHQVCPGHRAVWLPWTGRVDLFCVHPELHAPDGGPKWSDLEAQQRHARQREADRLAAEREANAPAPEPIVPVEKLFTPAQDDHLTELVSDLLAALPVAVLLALYNVPAFPTVTMEDDGGHVDSDELTDLVLAELGRALVDGTSIEPGNAGEDAPICHWLATTFNEAGVDLPRGLGRYIGLEDPEPDDVDDEQEVPA